MLIFFIIGIALLSCPAVESIQIIAGADDVESDPAPNDEETASSSHPDPVKQSLPEDDDTEETGVAADDESVDTEETSANAVSSTASRLFAEGMRQLESSDTRFASHQQAFQMFTAAAQLGHVEAKAWVGLNTLMGWSAYQSLPQARATLSDLADHGGSPVAHFGLGLIHAAGLAVNASSPLALLHYTFGAAGDNALAHLALGYRYLYGVGVESSCESALVHYYHAAQSVYHQLSNRSQMGGSSLSGPTIYRASLIEEADKASVWSVLFPYGANLYSAMFGAHDQQQPIDLDSGGYFNSEIGSSEQLLQYFQFTGDQQNASAQLLIGQIYYHGHYGVEVSYSKALEYLRRAADGDNAAAKAYLGEMYMTGNAALKADPEKALQYLREAAEANNAVGQTLLAMAYLHGHAGLQQNQFKAVELLIVAAKQGWPDAQLQLGRFFLGSLDGKSDYKLALKYFQMAAQQGNTMALYHLAEMHATGTGVDRSCTSATELFKNVAERGRWSKWFMYAHAAYRAERFDQAVVTYLLLAELGFEVAQSNAAYLLETTNVLGLSKADAYERAIRYWQRSASQGSSVARVKLGDYYYYGWGTERDYAKSVQHYKVASDVMHNPQAMFNLAYMHEQGIGLDSDIHLAKRYYDRATEVSADARIPVKMAMLRLGFYFAMDYISNSYNIKLPFGGMFNSPSTKTSSLKPDSSNSRMDWDFYLIPLLAGLLAVLIVYLQLGVRRGGNVQQRQQQQQ